VQADPTLEVQVPTEDARAAAVHARLSDESGGLRALMAMAVEQEESLTHVLEASVEEERFAHLLSETSASASRGRASCAAPSPRT
jgi:hypothetical protein